MYLGEKPCLNGIKNNILCAASNDVSSREGDSAFNVTIFFVNTKPNDRINEALYFTPGTFIRAN